MAKKPDISTKDLRKDWDQNVKFLNNISAFPEEWYNEKDGYTKIYSARSTNSVRPKLGARSQTLNVTSNNAENNMRDEKSSPIKEEKSINQKRYEDEFENDE